MTATTARYRGSVKILDLYCGHTARRSRRPYANGISWPDGVPCPHGCPGRQPVLRWADTGKPRRRPGGG